MYNHIIKIIDSYYNYLKNHIEDKIRLVDNTKHFKQLGMM